LNCKKTVDGKNYRHGETWCIYDAQTGKGQDPAGSRQWKHICIAGEELVEPCADFRQEVCTQDKIETGKGPFQQAGCTPNRWQSCTQQKTKDDCENIDKRDCQWVEGVIGIDSLGQGTANATIAANSAANTKKDKDAEVKALKKHGVCLPDVAPGLKFWEEGEAQTICAQGNAVCTVQYEKGLISSGKATTNSECLGNDWLKKRQEVCMALGDCSASVKTCENGKCTVKEGIGTYLAKRDFGVSGTASRIIAGIAKYVSNDGGIATASEIENSSINRGILKGGKI
jgi:hypothetical protein